MIIHKDELWDAADTIMWVYDAAMNRYDDLKGMEVAHCPDMPIFDDLSFVLSELFKQQRADPIQQFKSYASELVREHLASGISLILTRNVSSSTATTVRSSFLSRTCASLNGQNANMWRKTRSRISIPKQS